MTLSTSGALLLTALIAYFLGSIPFGLILTRLSGAGDIRQIGSGNIGATNVLRTGRRGIAAATLFLDAFKGLAAVTLARLVWPVAEGPHLLETAMGIAAICVVLGHCFPVWLHFRGGKGVATGIGALWGLCWPVGLACTLIWVLGVKISRISSVGALGAFLAAPLLTVLFCRQPPLSPLALSVDVLALIVLCRHKDNFLRLARGAEPRVGRAPSDPTLPDA
ncbi:glycerol-3-phosphate 1-O-acyltransferase PlsY [Oecophyllibacter saccharovorans]|uniref:Glycerol-3-phosphate acyltransferase n=1 Tax=Oecophyllibacter saccharovorans TaxID=2558360 RepID=A0A506ULS2_9PROT|nr:glycerol-3-phosphate 1-O-acyltransferase PlsY [Oecophyllibacter saccharovorans]TPW34279.1 glycerol-3-phosphate 1-O-acyltransferase PlsY [Oecophyllibacter saccharovorans]